MKHRGLFLCICVLAAGLACSTLSAAPQKEEGEIVLNFPTFWVGQDSKAGPIADLVQQFNAQNAGRIRVVIEANPDTDGYRLKLNASMAAGVVPDIFVFNPDPTTFQYYDADLLLDFTEELKGPWAQDFAPGYIEASTKKGYTKTVPFETGLTPIWYNRELFDRAGVGDFPKRFDEFWAVTEKLKAAGITPTSQMTGGANAWTSMLWYSHILASISGPEIWKNPLPHPQYAQAAEILLRMYQDGNTTRDAVGGDAGVAGGHYMAGRTAIFSNGPWYIGRIKRDAPAVHAVTRLAHAPAVEGGVYGGEIGFLLSNLAAANTNDPARRAAVLQFIRWLTRPENVKIISERSGAMFALKYQLGEQVDPLLKQFIEISSSARFSVGHFESQFPAAVTQELGQALGAMALGKVDPQGFVQMLIQANK
jgi:raffinose/stachyose/melibiose transport system substrate-binding protein